MADDPLLDAGPYREGLRRWIAEEGPVLQGWSLPRSGSMVEGYRHDLGLVRLLAAAGWSRYGWAPEAGGRGGSAELRAVLYDELAIAGIRLPELYLVLETLGPLVQAQAPVLAATELPAFISGERSWCQAFSEPETGSDLASLRTRLASSDQGWRLTGHKMWCSFGAATEAAVVLARTGTPESRHRGLTMVWVDLRTPGCDLRPIRAETGRDEFAEIFFDDVAVGNDAIIGAVDGGWAAAMYLLQFERGMYAWQRQAYLHGLLDVAVAAGVDGPGEERAVGDAYLAVCALRNKCRGTVAALAAGETTGPRTSVDKVLLATAEQTVFDRLELLARDALLTGDGQRGKALREGWFFSRAASIYGGAIEVQRDIIAQHLLGLGAVRGR